MFRSLPPFGGDQRQVAEIVRGIMDLSISIDKLTRPLEVINTSVLDIHPRTV